MSLALSHAVRAQTTAPNGRVAVEPVAKRIRVRFGGEVIADTEHALLLLERDHLPVYYLPLADINGEFLEAVDTASVCPWKGTARYWDIVVGDRRAANAVWSYPEDHPDALDLSAYAAFYWDRVDEWYEEDEPVSVHPRDPYVRVDVLRSSRHVTATPATSCWPTRAPRGSCSRRASRRVLLPAHRRRASTRSRRRRPSAHRRTSVWRGISRSGPRTAWGRTSPGSIRSRPPRPAASRTWCRSIRSG